MPFPVRTLLFLLAATLSFPLVAVESEYRFVLHNLHVSKFKADGFEAPGVVHSTLKDRSGRIWIGTELGLFLFDGNEVRKFEHHPSNPRTLPHSFAKAIIQSGDGTIWIGTWGGGLARFDEARRSFERVAPAGEDVSRFDGKIWSMATDRQQRLWIGTFSSGLFRYDPESNTLRQAFFLDQPEQQLGNRIETVYVDRHDNVWFGPYMQGLRIIDAETFSETIEAPEILAGHAISNVIPFDEESLMVADHRNTILRVDHNGVVLDRVRLSGLTDDDSIMRALPLDTDRVLIGTAGSGLWHADLGTGAAFPLPAGDHPGAMERTIIWDMKLAHDGDILVAAHDGFYIIPAASRTFWTIAGFEGRDAIFFEHTRAIERDDEALYLNSESRVFRIEFAGIPDQPLVLSGELIAQVEHGRPMDMKRDRDGVIWLVTEDRKRGVQYMMDGSGQRKLRTLEGYRGAHTLLRDNEGSVRIAYGGRMRTLKQKPSALDTFIDPEHQTWTPQRLSVGRNGDAWAGHFGGLERYSLETGEMLPVFSDSYEAAGKYDSYTTFVKPISGDAMLVGGKDGIWRAQLDGSGAIRSMTNIFDGHPFQTASFAAAIPIEKRFLFIGEPGIVEFDLVTGKIESLSADEGFPTYGVYLGDFHYWDDVVVLSGTAGPLLFDPSRIDLTTPPRELHVTDIRSFRNDGQVAWSTSSENLQFEYQDRVIRFKFGLLDYLNPMNNEYSLRLQGFQDEWINLGRMREFSFTNLNAGTYVLDIRVDETTTGKSASTSIRFNVLPPWWRTWWAYSLYVLIIFGSLFLYWLSLQRKIAREQEISSRLREADRIKSHFLNELESKVEDATQDLRHAVEALEIKNIELGATQQRAIDASRLKSEFLANMSHEIRTPMNGVLGFTQLLQKSNLDNDQRDYVETIDKSAKSLLGIINDVLDVSKIEAGKLIIDSSGFDLRECVADTLQALAPVAYDKNLELIGHVDDSLPDGLRSDPTRLRQMLTNLVGNAIKFTDSGHVYVHVEKASAGDGEERLRISVSDTGRGISAEDREKLFHAFERGSVDLAGRYTGTGLGLVITKKLCEAMGGRVELDSVPGKGTQVVLELPLVVDRNPENRYGFGKPLKNRRIVIIDPHTQSREALRSRLTHWGADITALADVVEPAMQDADLVIFGVERIRLGDTRGLETLQRKLPQNVPGLCMAASVDRDALRSIAEACGTPCIPKVGHLESQLRRICEALDIGMDATQVDEAAPARLAGLHVLVADDNRINRYFLKKILEMHGARVTEVDSGQGVLRILDSLDGKLDIALLDVHMPDIDGLEVARRIRARGNRKLPLLAVSANVQTETHEAAIAAGINDYLLKPVEEMKLVEAVLEWTGREVVTSDE